MEPLRKTRVLFIAGFGPIVRDAAASRILYGQILGIAFKEESGGYLHTEALSGAKTFALWPLSQAAQSCFGYRMLVKSKKEPWGPTVTRFIGPEGLLVGVTLTPSLRKQQ